MRRLIAVDVRQTGVRVWILNSGRSSYELDLVHHNGIHTEQSAVQNE